MQGINLLVIYISAVSILKNENQLRFSSPKIFDFNFDFCN